MIANLLRKRASSRAHRRLDSWWPSPPHWRQCFPGQSIPGPQYKYLFLPSSSSPISEFPCRPEMTPHRCNPRHQNPKLIKSMPTNRSTKNDFEADLQAEWGFMALWHAIAMGQQCDLCFFLRHNCFFLFFSYPQHFEAMCTWFCKDSYEFAAAAACLGSGFLSSYFRSSGLGYAWWLWMSSAKPQCSLTRHKTSIWGLEVLMWWTSSLQKPNANQVN